MTGVFEPARIIARRIMEYPFKVWGFGEGIALEALWQAGIILDEPSFQRFVIDVFDRWLNREPPIQEADHSAPGGLLLTVFRQTDDERYLHLARRLADHMTSLPKDVSGAAFHRPSHPEYHHYIYVDCIEVDAPFLCQLAAAVESPSYYDLAAKQVLSYCQLLQDESTGFFFHQYDGEMKKTNGAFWGRGNGWALLGLLRTLELLPPVHLDYHAIKTRFGDLARALAGCQLSSGHWTTVLNRSASSIESSLPVMFGYAMQRAITLRLLPVSYLANVERAWQAAERQLRDGLLYGVSIATPPGDAAHYDRIPTGSGFPWGQGPALLFALTYPGDFRETS